MPARVSGARNTVYDILIMDADGQRVELESFQDLESARRRFPFLAAQYPGTNRQTRAVLEETEGY